MTIILEDRAFEVDQKCDTTTSFILALLEIIQQLFGTDFSRRNFMPINEGVGITTATGNT